jgi:hypothetical protein
LINADKIIAEPTDMLLDLRPAVILQGLLWVYTQSLGRIAEVDRVTRTVTLDHAGILASTARQLAPYGINRFGRLGLFTHW